MFTIKNNNFNDFFINVLPNFYKLKIFKIKFYFLNRSLGVTLYCMCYKRIPWEYDDGDILKSIEDVINNDQLFRDETVKISK